MNSPLELSEEQQEMPAKLTALQRKFAINLATGSMSQRQAYVKAGGRSKTEHGQDSSASEILCKPEVRAFYDSLIAQSATSAILTREQALEILTRNANQADKYKDQHTAIKQLSAMQGWDAPKKTELSGELDSRIIVRTIDLSGKKAKQEDDNADN